MLGFCLGMFENVLGVLGTFGFFVFFCDVWYNLGHFGMFWDVLGCFGTICIVAQLGKVG